ncbi:MAG: tetratricopeptide repeat protein [Fusobacteriaceae bacterium]
MQNKKLLIIINIVFALMLIVGGVFIFFLNKKVDEKISVLEIKLSENNVLERELEGARAKINSDMERSKFNLELANAIAQNETNKRLEALKKLLKVTEYQRFSDIIYFNIGENISKKNIAEKNKYYDMALQVNPEFAPAIVAKGKIKYNNKSFKSAIEFFSLAIDTDINSAEAFYFRAQSYYKLGNIKAAVSDITDAINLNQKYPQAYTYRGIFRNYMKDEQGALEDFQKAIEVDDEDYSAYYYLGAIYEKQKNKSEAQKNLKLASEWSGMKKDFAMKNKADEKLKKADKIFVPSPKKVSTKTNSKTNNKK